MKIRALIVGIENYRESGWDVTGPARAAQDVVRWLLDLRAIAVSIDLYIDDKTVLDQELEQEFAGANTRLRCYRTTDAQALENATGTQLADGVEPDTHLLIYWSGHGATSIEHAERLLLCGNYSKVHHGRVINVPQWLRRLRGPEFKCFKSQLLLADVCGDERQIPVLGASSLPDIFTRAPQVAVFASLQGKTTKSQSAGGQFTRIALGLLSEGDSYPDDVEHWSKKFVQALEAQSYEPYRIVVKTIHREDQICLGALSQGAAQETVCEMLSELGLNRWEQFGQCYSNTLADLGMCAKTATVLSLSQAIEDLADFAESSDGVSDALLQFLARMAQRTAEERPDVRDRIEAWMDIQPAHVKDRFDVVGALLERESYQRILLLVVQVGDDGHISHVAPYCCNSSGELIQSSPLEGQACNGWDAFAAQVCRILKPFLDPNANLNVSVQFAVDERLLACPFHRIQVGGDDLGSLVPVVVRKAMRMLNLNTPEARLAAKYAGKLKETPPQNWIWKPIALDGVFREEEWPSIATFSVGASRGASDAFLEMRRLKRVMSIGTALLHIPHEPPNCGQWQAVSNTLAAIARGAHHFNAFPTQFHQYRTRGEPHAENATLVWDDPGINPFIAPRGVNDRMPS